MSRTQDKFILRNDGKWWAPPIDKKDEVDYLVRFGELLGEDDTIDQVLELTVTNATFVSCDPEVEVPAAIGTQNVVVWVRAAVPRSIVKVETTIRSTGGRTYNRTFFIEVLDL